MNDYIEIHLENISSTSTYLKQLNDISNLGDTSYVVASYQSTGRGQRGNAWESEPGQNLLFSVLLKPHNVRATSQFVISQFISLAIKDVLDNFTDSVTIKWPNDIYWRDKKIAGILIENQIIGDKLNNSIIGIGLNINQTKFYSDAPNPISLSQINQQNYDIDDIMHEIRKRILFYYNLLDDWAGFDIIRDRYMKSLFRKDGEYLFEDNSGVFKASINDIKDTGVLSLKLKSGEIRQYSFKEVRFVL